LKSNKPPALCFSRRQPEKTGRFKSIPTHLRLHRRARSAAQRFVQRDLVLQVGEAGLHHGLLHGKLRALRVKPVELTADIRLFALAQSKSVACGQHGVALTLRGFIAQRQAQQD
jgi:hypothetical protein